MGATRLSSNQIKDGDIKNADVASDANIDITKLNTVSSLTAKTTPDNADVFPLGDSGASNVWKKLTWANLKSALGIDSKMSNPMTTAGDIIIGGTNGAPTRLAKGNGTQILSMVSGSPGWADASGAKANVAVLTSDFSASSVDYVEVTNMTLPLSANKKYIIVITGRVNTSNSQCRLYLSGSTTREVGTCLAMGTSNLKTTFSSLGGDYTVLITGSMGANVDFIFDGYIDVGSTGRTLTLQVAHPSSSVTVKAGTKMIAIEVTT